MKAIVVYESHWGNTAAVAQAIAEGIGPEARALDTDAATGLALEGVDLIVAGSPVIAFALPREGMRAQIAGHQGIYHLEHCGSYGRTKNPHRWFCSEAEAQAEGYRKSYTCDAR